VQLKTNISNYVRIINMGRICGQEGGFDQAVVSERRNGGKESQWMIKSGSGMEMVKQLGPRLREHGPPGCGITQPRASLFDHPCTDLKEMF